jgi:alkanesulfonate monooxygenase SsuD/methylene tetrahydromethanopterin reductase-like flavin-dependent oxidoreductase (luciferase family)
MPDIKLGMLLWSQAGTWSEMLTAARQVDELGYEHLWTWDHLYAIYGDPYQPIFEGWSLLAAWAMATERTRLGLLVGANTFRNPGLVARHAVTLDHVSGGRAILGIGGAWFEPEHQAHGIDFGSGFGQRLDWLEESAAAMAALLRGGAVTSEPGGRYAFEDLRLIPGPVRGRLPIMIGGSGEKKTLRTIARHADMWNAFGTAEVLRHKDGVLREHCRVAGRDESEIERTVGCKVVIRDTEAEARRVWEAQMARNRTPEDAWDGPESLWLGPPARIAEEIRVRAEVGFGTVIVEMPAPYDAETIERLVTEVKLMVEEDR